MIAGQLHASTPLIAALLGAHPDFDYLLVPGGIYGSSGVWLELAKERGIRVATYDSGAGDSDDGCLLISTDGIASHSQGLPQALEALWDEPDVLDSVLAEAHEERHKRRQGLDKFGLQAGNEGKYEIGTDNAVLIPLNTSWDAAALGLHAVFDSSLQWVLETVRWILSNTTATAIIRQHPGERVKGCASTDDYEMALRQHFGNDPRVRFIAAASPINTYELLEKSKVVVVHTSTVGVEAATMGKVVVTAARSYYSNLGFVFAADSGTQYFDVLGRAIEGQLSIDDNQIRKAWCCYYLAQCCNWIFFDFNPITFEKWAGLEIEALYGDPTVQDILAAIDENTPIALLRHRRALAQSEMTGC